MREIMMNGAAVALVTALLAPDPAEANDRDLRATVINPFSCTVPYGHEDQDRFMWVGWPHPYGLGFLADVAGLGMSLICPLPLNNVDLGGTTNDNDITSFTVYYSDFDGRAGGAWMGVLLREVTLVNGQLVSRVVCDWDSNRHGALASGPVSSNFPCAVDLVATAFYHFDVALINSSIVSSTPNTVAISFAGIRFP
jgi:hypothetical protein